MFRFSTLFLIFVLLTPAKAGPKKLVHWVGHHKLLIVTSAIFLAADFADSKTSLDVQKRCPTCVELNDDVFGSHPSPARMWGVSAAFDAGYIWLDWFGTKDTGLTGTHDFTLEEKEKHPRLYKLVWLEKPVTVAVMGWATEKHARAAWLNAQIPDIRKTP